MLIENRIVDGKIVEYSKVDVAIQRLRSFEPSDGYWLAFSGGKDSVVIKALADMAGVKYEAHYHLTTVDPPELVRFVKTFPDVVVDRPRKTMWELIIEKGTPPLRMSRYCCKELKESSGEGHVVITGIRWAESVRRKANRNLVNIGEYNSRTVFNEDNDESRRTVEQCYRTRKTLVNPIIDWSDDEVWEFIRKYNVRYCTLYDEGWKRLGCIGCPMAQQEREFERWPTYKTAYIHAFDRMIKKRIADRKPVLRAWGTGQECFSWWIGKSSDEATMEGQIDLYDKESDDHETR
jgi:phosphoadenosine phosphosulfate reductase